MIPAFPAFGPILLEDRAAFVPPHGLPYGDFAHTLLYAFAEERRIEVANLNGNIVLRLTDGLSGTPFVAYSGTHDPIPTASTLLRASEGEGWSPELRLIPEEAAKV